MNDAMFAICPVSYPMEDAQWFLNKHEARDSALDWSVELAGESVIVYTAIPVNGFYQFKQLYQVWS